LPSSVGSSAGDARELGIRTGAALTAARRHPRHGRAVGLAAAEGSWCAIDHPAVEVVHLAVSRRSRPRGVVHSLGAEEVEVSVDFRRSTSSVSGSRRFLERRERDVTGTRLRRPGVSMALAVDPRAA
jgi:hypothetical protein